MADITTLNLVCSGCNMQIGPSPPAPDDVMYLLECGHVACMACVDESVLDLTVNEDQPPSTVLCLRCGDNVLSEPRTRVYFSNVDFTAGGDTPDMVCLREQAARLSAELDELYRQASAELALLIAATDRVEDLEKQAGLSGSHKRRRFDDDE
ncbi:hypothetical protein FRC12_012986 [Ceratobasidium sp. 428]|nr:hypothetical protein FRC12_012986 [Ceratobasidium sp. 428]